MARKYDGGGVSVVPEVAQDDAHGVLAEFFRSERWG